MIIDSHKTRLEHALTELGNASFGPFAACFADDIVWTITGTTPWSRSYEGERAVLEMLRALGARIDGPYRMRAHRIVADGDIVVVEGRGDNKLRSGERYDNTYCWVCRFEGGKLRELVEYMDTELVARVLGSEKGPEGWRPNASCIPAISRLQVCTGEDVDERTGLAAGRPALQGRGPHE